MRYPTISMWELEQWIDRGYPFSLVDLRTEGEYAASHIRGAVNLPFSQLEEREDELEKGSTTVFYCQRGSKSLLACNRLAGRGFRVVNTGGGFLAYRGKYLVQSVDR